ncbi:MAG: hypothetical protein WCE68_08185 [Anaerolineales bacterium]
MNSAKISLRILLFLSGCGMGAIDALLIQDQTVKIIIFILFAASLLLDTALSIYDLRQNSWKDFSENARNAEDVLQQTLDLACIAMGKGQTIFRANIFQKRPRSQKLRICYYSKNMVGAPDLDITLEKWQGCTGHAWGYEAPTVADLTIPAVGGGARWGLEEEQLKLTKGIATIFALPIRHPEHNKKIIGILSFDTKEAVADSITQDEYRDIALSVSKQVGFLLFGFGQVKSLND